MTDVVGSSTPNPLGTPRHWPAILGLCLVVVAVEGYDVQAMAFAAPLLAKTWHLSAGLIGLLLTASVLGIISGSIFLAPLGDRVGRRRSVIIGLLVAGLFTLGCALAPNLPVLAILRIAAGLGLGMAMPNIIAIALEIAPLHRRAFAVVVANCGYPLGAAAGGALASRLMSSGSFSVIFRIGAGATLLALAVSVVVLPETFSGRDSLPAAAIDMPSLDGRSTLLRVLFSPRYKLGTTLFWILNFFGIAIVYFFVSWLPTLLSLDGLSNQQTLTATAIFNLSGVAGGILIAIAQRRLRTLDILVLTYGAAIVAVVGLGVVHGQGLLLPVLALGGAAIAGSQFALSAAVNRYYPTEIRVGASGFALGVGRVGAIAAPLTGGVLLAATHSARQAFLLIIAPAAIALLCALYLRVSKRAGQSAFISQDAAPPIGPILAPRAVD